MNSEITIDNFPNSFLEFRTFVEKFCGKCVKKLQYRDDEGDDITITSDLDLLEAKKAAIKEGSLNVQVTFEENPNHSSVHRAFCDVCRTQIRGIRYKCYMCDDYDLCEKM